MPDIDFKVGTTPETLADQLPWVGNFVLVALETQDRSQNGRMWAVRLAELASRAEMYFLTWEKERRSEAAKAAST